MEANACTETVSEARTSAPEKHSYTQILKSSALVGGSSAINIAIGIVRTKAMAVLLGPAGFGLAGLYGSIADVAHSVAGMGINSSGVRQIAEAAGSDDKERKARTAAVLRRTSILLGVLGAVLLVAFSRQASALTFGSDEHFGAICLLSAVVFFRLVSGGQGALIQGMRRISDLAKMNVLGSIFGLLVTIPLVYFYREQGVVPSLVAVAGMSLAVSWWYSRKIHTQPVALTYSQIGQETAALLRLGLAFMASSLMMMGSAYAVRVIVLHKVGFEATGLYQAAWTLGGLYVGFLLQAMGMDFYPRLTAVAQDHKECNRLVNEQTCLGLLLGGPGAIATITCAPFVIAVFYSETFAPAVDLLRWICLGVGLRLVTWPMGFILLAKGEKGLFFCVDLAWTLVNVGFTWIFVGHFGLRGAGIAFFGSYVFHGLLIYSIVNRLSGFKWTDRNRTLSVRFLFAIGGVFITMYGLPLPIAMSIGVLAALTSAIYSTHTLFSLVPPNQLPLLLRHIAAVVTSLRTRMKEDE
jgi:antigen flippase